MTARDWVEVTLALTIPLSILSLMLVQWHAQGKWGKPLGVRLIQTITACTFMPAVVILAMERILEGEAVAALIGGVIGYLFSNIREPNAKKPEAASPSGA
jgi:hypothetical protein